MWGLPEATPRSGGCRGPAVSTPVLSRQSVRQQAGMAWGAPCAVRLLRWSRSSDGSDSRTFHAACVSGYVKCKKMPPYDIPLLKRERPRHTPFYLDGFCRSIYQIVHVMLALQSISPQSPPRKTFACKLFTSTDVPYILTRISHAVMEVDPREINTQERPSY